MRRASDAFEDRLRLVDGDDWSRPTPCSEWDVRALVNHVVGGNRRYVLLLHGASADAVDRTRGDDHLADDAVSSFVTTAAEVTAAFHEDGVASRIAHHPVGDRTGAELLAMRVIDLTVHTWDLARALGADDTLDAVAVEYSLAHIDIIEPSRHRGSYAAPAGPSRDEDSPQLRLLHLAGRSPKEEEPR